MYINTTVLEEYCTKNGMSVTTSFDIEHVEPILKFTKGKDRNGSRVEFLTFENFKEILVVNNMLGDEGRILKERDATREELLQRNNKDRDQDKNIEVLTYDTLSKYIIQMLNAGTGRIYFPEIIPLENHKAMYFRID